MHFQKGNHCESSELSCCMGEVLPSKFEEQFACISKNETRPGGRKSVVVHMLRVDVFAPHWSMWDCGRSWFGEID